MGFYKNLFNVLFRRPVKGFNVENRAHRVLEKNETKRPKVAPRHPTTANNLDQFSRDNPDLLELQKKKNSQLDEMLKGMVVNPERPSEIRTAARRLPETRTAMSQEPYGYVEPENIPVGKCTLKQSLDFIANHQQSPDTQRAEQIASQYKLDGEQVKHVLTYFQTLQLHIPQDKADDRIATKQEPKQISSQTNTTDNKQTER